MAVLLHGMIVDGMGWEYDLAPRVFPPSYIQGNDQPEN